MATVTSEALKKMIQVDVSFIKTEKYGMVVRVVKVIYNQDPTPKEEGLNLTFFNHVFHDACESIQIEMDFPENSDE